jgi:tetratricopeptide (TPR) repeat protein
VTPRTPGPKATTIAPKLSENWEARCENLFENLRAYGEAEAVATAALAIHPHRAVFVLERARTAYMRKDFVTALPFYRRYAELYPKDASARANHAYALAATGSVDEAVALSKAVFDAARTDEGDVAVEVGFYLFALTDETEQSNRLARLRALLDAGKRTADWNFEPIITAAVARNHPEAA